MNFEALIDICGSDRVRTDSSTLVAYSVDATVGYRGNPSAVIFPINSNEIRRVFALCSSQGWNIVVRGGGTSLAGGAVPSDHGIVMSTELLDTKPIVDAQSMTISAGAGVTTADLQTAAAKKGLFFPPDPSSQSVAMLGGNLATNAGGSFALKYGVIRDYVLTIEAVTPSGDIVIARRGDPTEPLLDLMIGSEGTLGLIISATLRLIRPPPTVSTIVARFYTADQAMNATVEILKMGVVPGRMEFMDEVSIAAVQLARDYGLANTKALLILELHGTEKDVTQKTKVVLSALNRNGSQKPLAPATFEEATVAWNARSAITSSLARLKPGKIGEDICVPRSKLPRALREISKISTEVDLLIAVFGHVGDGTLHPNVSYDPSSMSECQRMKKALSKIAEIGIALGGVLSGEHGIGRVKLPYVDKAYDQSTIAAMASIKKAFDPLGVLNPNLTWKEKVTDYPPKTAHQQA
tara:strand:- start:2163 stop:3560 length:1398 start_codon:yes stop_codon:yes gene_type:complete